MANFGGNGEGSPGEYQAKPGYGECPSLSPEGAPESYLDGYGVPPVIEQCPGCPPPIYTPPAEQPAFSPAPVQYSQAQQYQPHYPQVQPCQQSMPHGAPYPARGGYVQPTGMNGLAIASFVASRAVVIFGLGAIIGIILGVIALNQIKAPARRAADLRLRGSASEWQLFSCGRYSVSL